MRALRANGENVKAKMNRKRLFFMNGANCYIHSRKGLLPLEATTCFSPQDGPLCRVSLLTFQPKTSTPLQQSIKIYFCYCLQANSYLDWMTMIEIFYLKKGICVECIVFQKKKKKKKGRCVCGKTAYSLKSLIEKQFQKFI